VSWAKASRCGAVRKQVMCVGASDVCESSKLEEAREQVQGKFYACMVVTCMDMDLFFFCSVKPVFLGLGNLHHVRRVCGCLWTCVLTPKIGTWKRQTCRPSLVEKTPFGKRFSSKHSVKAYAIGSMSSFGRRVVSRLEEKAFGNA
jgi:hypothetical protein